MMKEHQEDTDYRFYERSASMVWAVAGNLPEQNQNNKCINRSPGTAVKKYAGTYDFLCTFNIPIDKYLFTP